jgi:peroxiredoxin (alkyl hydroperoxide reductase subunit C)
MLCDRNDYQWTQNKYQLLDPGIIKVMEITCEGVGRDAESLLQKVKAAQYIREHPGEVCPAKWKEGETTLAPSLDLVGKI